MCLTTNSRRRVRDHNHLAEDLGLTEVHDSLGVVCEAARIVVVLKESVHLLIVLFLSILSY